MHDRQQELALDSVGMPPVPLAATHGYRERPRCRGKFLYAGDAKYWVLGVTYGTFRPNGAGEPFPEPGAVERDFGAMAAAGLNTVRTYTPPPRWLLDTAERHGLRVMAGLAWEQHVAFLDDRRLRRTIEARVREGAASCAGHPALLCYSVGNEIPPSIVRWHGRRAVERFIERLYRIVKAEDPGALATYVNFPTTEYLELPFLDLYCFNVYLEQPDRLADYLARLQNLAGEHPLLMAEIGLDSRRNGEAVQAESLAWQVRAAFAEGCAGAFVFAWTDEWHRGGHDIDDWDFGLVTRDRRPKPALAAVSSAFAEAPFPPAVDWPRVSVVVCSYNGARTIRDTLEGLAALDYPDYEVIVIDDGSTDATPEIAREYEVRLISTENRGLSNARNTGWQEATGEIVAYIDDDAYPDPHWLRYLAHAFLTNDWVGAGGPNIAPPGDGPIADCIANAPGGPVHVLLTDRVAEHIPGCNMAFRRDALATVGGFDARYRAAGDDVDLCWRLQDNGGTIGFHAGAMDWHHRRNSVAMFWRQQKGYGKAEALLEEKWPQRYNPMGHLTWGGRLYGKGWTLPALAGRWRVYHGTWGSAPFQSLYRPGPGTWLSLPLMPEWYLLVALLALLALVGLTWMPLLAVTLPLLALSVTLPVLQALRSAAAARFTSNPRTVLGRGGLRAVTALLHLMQPLARLIGRIQHGLTPWRRRGAERGPLWSRDQTVWSERWRTPEAWVAALESALVARGCAVGRGGDCDRFDLQVRGGPLGAVRGLVAVEEHGAGKQLVRLRARPRPGGLAIALTGVFAGLAFLARADSAWVATAVLAAVTLVLVAQTLVDVAVAAACWQRAVATVEAGARHPD